MMNNMGNRSSDLQIQKDNNYANGLILRGYHLPEEIISEILSKLSPQDILNCRLVCKRWSDIVSFILYNCYNKAYNTLHTHETLPFDICYIGLFSKRCRENLLKNVNGEQKFKHWKILQNGGDGVIVEDPPSGSDALPEGVEEFKGHTSCFASSYGIGRKEQIIDITKNKYLFYIINEYKPHIYASEWVAGRFDCGAKYEMCVKVKCKENRIIEGKVQHRVEQWEGNEWIKKEILIDDYPDGVEQIVFIHSAVDTQFWKGHYGMKMAGAVVKLLLDKIKV